MALMDLVWYKISAQDETSLAQSMPFGARGGIRIGKLPVAGEQLRASIVRDHGGNVVNLNVHIDANLPYHKKEVTQGSGNGQWSVAP